MPYESGRYAAVHAIIEQFLGWYITQIGFSRTLKIMIRHFLPRFFR